jgi:uncharacterized membrane protein
MNDNNGHRHNIHKGMVIGNLTTVSYWDIVVDIVSTIITFTGLYLFYKRLKKPKNKVAFKLNKEWMRVA